MCNNLKSLKKNIPADIVKRIEVLAENEEEELLMCEEFIERAGIMEYDGGQSRFMAERNALMCVLRNYWHRGKKTVEEQSSS